MESVRPSDRRERTPWVALVLVLALAVGLRVVGLQWGLPDRDHIFSYHPDEYHSLRGAMSALLAGDPNPHFFNYGSLYLYLVTGAVVLADSPVPTVLNAESMAQMLRDWTVAARHLNLVLAVLTVLVVYFLGRQLLGARFGVLAAFALAVFPLHVLHSHYATVDVPQAFFIALALLFAVRIGQKAETRDYLYAGLCVGLAASVKYNGAVVLIAPLIAHFVSRVGASVPDARAPGDRRTYAWQPLAMLALAVAAFALTSPYTFLDWTNARRDILFEIQHMRLGEEPARSADPSGWLFHGLGLTLTTGGATVVALVGIVGAFWRKWWRAALGPVIFGLLWFVMIALANVRYGRYEVALTPLLALLVAGGAAALHGKRPELRLLAVLLPAAAIGFSLGASLLIVARLHSTPDPRDVGLQAVIARVPPDHAVGMVWEPWFNAPPLDPLNGGQALRANPFWRQFSRPVRPLAITGLDAAALRREQPFGFVLGNFEMRDAERVHDPGAAALREALREEYLTAAISEREAPLSGLLGWVPPQDWLYAFPEITVYVRSGPPGKPPAPPTTP